MADDQVIYLKDGFYAMVDGRLYGPWPMKEYAEAGLATEKRRAEKRQGDSHHQIASEGIL